MKNIFLTLLFLVANANLYAQNCECISIYLEEILDIALLEQPSIIKKNKIKKLSFALVYSDSTVEKKIFQFNRKGYVERSFDDFFGTTIITRDEQNRKVKSETTDSRSGFYNGGRTTVSDYQYTNNLLQKISISHEGNLSYCGNAWAGSTTDYTYYPDGKVDTERTKNINFDFEIKHSYNKALLHDTIRFLDQILPEILNINIFNENNQIVERRRLLDGTNNLDVVYEYQDKKLIKINSAPLKIEDVVDWPAITIEIFYKEDLPSEINYCCDDKVCKYRITYE